MNFTAQHLVPTSKKPHHTAQVPDNRLEDCARIESCRSQSPSSIVEHINNLARQRALTMISGSVW